MPQRQGWVLIDWIRRKTRPFRELLPQARLDRQSSWHDIPNLIGLTRGRLFGKGHIHLSFSNQYAYKFRYLHRGLTQLAARAKIHYTFAYDSTLGRKTAVIRYETRNHRPAVGVIDGSSITWQLGHPDLDFSRVFGDGPRVLFKLKFGLGHIHDRSSGYLFDAPPIGQLYDQVLDGGYWPTNTRFLDSRWVMRQRHRALSPVYDVHAIFGLYQQSLGGELLTDSFDSDERIRFLFKVGELTQAGVQVRAGAKIRRGMTLDSLPQAIRHLVADRFLPFDDYLDEVFQSRMLLCPKSFAAERTYRLVENLCLGLVCLSTPVGLHFDFRPGVHYVELAEDLSDLKDVILYYREHSDELDRIRQNVLPLYEQYLSPLAIARYYYRTLQALSENQDTPDLSAISGTHQSPASTGNELLELR